MRLASCTALGLPISTHLIRLLRLLLRTDDGANGIEAVEDGQDGAFLGLPAGVGYHPRDDERVCAPHEAEAVVSAKGKLPVLFGPSVGVVEERDADHHRRHHSQEDHALLLEARGEVGPEEDGKSLEGAKWRVEQCRFLPVSSVDGSRSPHLPPW